MLYTPTVYFFWVMTRIAALSEKSRLLTGRAGGARADDNFTKKPQKKLIRYMILFWRSRTK